MSLSSVYAQSDDLEYVGARKCRVCHRSEEKGDQHGMWSETRHASALETLMGDQAIKIAADMGLETAPSEAPECLECHTTGYGKAGGYEVLSADFVADPVNKKVVKKNTALGSVGCESCHGPGSAYKGKKVMIAIFDGSTEAESVGLKKATEETCRGCHNEKSPSFKEFDFDKMYPKISHPYPEGFRSE